jgi:uncharacterized membrane protein
MNLLTNADMSDIIAFIFFLLCWFTYAFLTKSEERRKHSLLTATNRYRYQWMRQMLKRDNRSIDEIMLGNLMRSSTFSANNTILILAGLISMLSYHDKIGVILGAIPLAKPMTQIEWEVKVFLMILIFIFAFFKYTWSIRQQNYTSIFIAAAPMHDEPNVDHDMIAKKGAFLASNAAEHSNNGLRAYYFGLAALAWFVHPYLFMAATAWVLYVTYRREYRSQTLKHLQ